MNRPMSWGLHENLMGLCRERARCVGFRRGFAAGFFITLVAVKAGFHIARVLS